MEQEQILSTLTEKLGQTSFSSQSLSKYVECNLPASGTEPDDSYWEKHVSILKTFQGQFNHDVAEKVTEQANAKFEEYKKNWTPPADPDSCGGQAGTPELTTLKEELSKIQARLNSQEQKHVQEELVKQVRSEMRKQNAKDDYVLSKTLDGITLDSAKSLSELTSEMLSRYDAEYKACRGDGAAPRTAQPGGGGNSSIMDRRFERKFRKEGLIKEK